MTNKDDNIDKAFQKAVEDIKNSQVQDKDKFYRFNELLREAFKVLRDKE